MRVYFSPIRRGSGDFAVPGYGHIGRGTLSAEPACVFGKGLWSAYGGGSPREIYYIKGLLFPLQILVIRELSKEGQYLAEPFEKRTEAG